MNSSKKSASSPRLPPDRPPPYYSSTGFIPTPTASRSLSSSSHIAHTLMSRSVPGFDHSNTRTRMDSSDDEGEEEDGSQEPIYTSSRSRSSMANGVAIASTSNLTTPATASGNQPTTTTPTTTPTAGQRRNGPSNPISTGLRHRLFNTFKSRSTSSLSFSKVKTISTTPGQLGAGETETEADEPPRRLPTARIVSSSGPLIPPNTLQQRLTPFLFEFSRLLAIVPAVVGILYNLYHVYNPPTFPNRRPPERTDYLVSALWAILTGHQCLALTTGLLTRWRLYYQPLSTLVRLLALQGICWPATQLTLSLFEHQKRPVIVWALIGTTTCCSRSVQIWVTSNLWWETRVGGGGVAEAPGGDVDRDSTPDVARSAADSGDDDEVPSVARPRRGYWRRWGGKWGGRRWDWKEVGVKCVLPAGIMYFVTAWSELLRREWGMVEKL